MTSCLVNFHRWCYIHVTSNKCDRKNATFAKEIGKTTVNLTICQGALEVIFLTAGYTADLEMKEKKQEVIV